MGIEKRLDNVGSEDRNIRDASVADLQRWVQLSNRTVEVFDENGCTTDPQKIISRENPSITFRKLDADEQKQPLDKLINKTKVDDKEGEPKTGHADIGQVFWIAATSVFV